MEFVAPSWLQNRHAMTIVANVLRKPPSVPLERHRWELEDGDFLDVDRLSSKNGRDTGLIIACHGLEGSSQAGYIRGILRLAHLRGLSALALNFRGCSGEMNRLPRLYHSGETGDLALVIDRLVKERPGRPLALVGFSLGGNVITKYLGERGKHLPDEVRAAAVVSVPFDLSGCNQALDGPDLPALLYRQRFLKKLRQKAHLKAQRFPGLIEIERVKRATLLKEFDHAVTAPLHGFVDADDYYTRSSSGPFLKYVARPLLVISAEDDPFIPKSTLPYAALSQNPLIKPLISKTGGHVGFLGGSLFIPERYAEETAVAFLHKHLG